MLLPVLPGCRAAKNTQSKSSKCVTVITGALNREDLIRRNYEVNKNTAAS